MDKMKKESVIISATLTQDMVNELDRIASKFGVTPNKLIVNFIIAGFDEIHVAERLGLLKKIWAMQNFLKQYRIDIRKERAENVEHSRTMNISIRLDKELNEELDGWAKTYGKTKSAVLESCLGISIDNYKKEPLNTGSNLLKLMDAIRSSIQDTAALLKKWNKQSKRAKEISNEMFNLTIK
jgi:metal-responsive CopG/Arc/MetJ family transcriptional regulator